MRVAETRIVEGLEETLKEVMMARVRENAPWRGVRAKHRSKNVFEIIAIELLLKDKLESNHLSQ